VIPLREVIGYRRLKRRELAYHLSQVYSWTRVQGITPGLQFRWRILDGRTATALACGSDTVWRP